jgi:hypothetical protein
MLLGASHPKPRPPQSMDEKFDRLFSETRELRAEMRAGFSELRGESARLREEVRAEVGGVNARIGGPGDRLGGRSAPSALICWRSTVTSCGCTAP